MDARAGVLQDGVQHGGHESDRRRVDGESRGRAHVVAQRVGALVVRCHNQHHVHLVARCLRSTLFVSTVHQKQSKFEGTPELYRRVPRRCCGYCYLFCKYLFCEYCIRYLLRIVGRAALKDIARAAERFVLVRIDASSAHATARLVVGAAKTVAVDPAAHHRRHERKDPLKLNMYPYSEHFFDGRVD